ncbi:hypothetical protein ATI45_1112 [Marinobacter sp. LV10MA510-1]|nr:hypothetical protein ATI45_1112 [Marinobacter sp. LV10MA510-1]
MTLKDRHFVGQFFDNRIMVDQSPIFVLHATEQIRQQSAKLFVRELIKIGTTL